MLISSVCATENNTISSNKEITQDSSNSNQITKTSNNSLKTNDASTLNKVEKTQTKSLKTNNNNLTQEKSIKTSTKKSVAKQVYVSPKGSDKNNGSIKAPFKTLQKTFKYAMTSSNNVKSIYIYNGQYSIDKTTYITKSIDIVGQSNKAVITMKNTNLFEVTKSNLTVNINKLTIRNGTGTYGSVVKINAPSTTLNIYNVAFTNNMASQGGTITTLSNTNKITIRSSKFTNNYANIRGGAVCFSGYGSSIQIIKCEFLNNAIKSSSSSAGTVGTGGAVYVGGNNKLSVTNSTFRNNCAGSAGAIYNANNATLTISLSLFDNNKANYTNSYGYGGALMIGNGILNVSRSTFKYNSAIKGGAISINSGTKAFIYNSVFTKNTATIYGGAVYSFADLNISKSKFTSNTAGERGGAFYGIGQGDVISISNSNFLSNYAKNSKNTGFGGAIAGYGRMSTYYITNSYFQNNQANKGGAIASGSSYVNWNLVGLNLNYNIAKSSTISEGGAFYSSSKRSKLSIISSSFKYNKAKGSIRYGGAISIQGSTNIVSLKSNTFTGNYAQYGGAIYNALYNYITIRESNFTKNKVDGKNASGGAIASYDDIIVLESIFLRNNASYRGGAMYLDSSGQILGSSLYNNIAGSKIGNNIYSSKKTIRAMYNWWGYNNITKIKTTNYNVNDSCPIVFSGKIINYTYNAKAKTTSYLIYMDTYFYNDDCSLYSLTHVMPMRNVLISNKINKETKTLALSYKGYINYVIHTKGYKDSVKLTLDGETLNLVYRTISEVSVKNYQELSKAISSNKCEVLEITLTNKIYKANKIISLSNTKAKQITITGNNFVIDGQNKYSFMRIPKGYNVSISNVVLQHFTSKAIINQGTLSITASTIKENNVKTATKTYGILYNKGNMILNKNTFMKNKASYGGVIFNDGGNVIAKYNTIKNNTALIYGGFVYNKGTIKILSNTITNNNAKDGRIIYNTKKATLMDNTIKSSKTYNLIVNKGSIVEVNNTYDKSTKTTLTTTKKSNNNYVCTISVINFLGLPTTGTVKLYKNNKLIKSGTLKKGMISFNVELPSGKSVLVAKYPTNSKYTFSQASKTITVKPLSSSVNITVVNTTVNNTIINVKVLDNNKKAIKNSVVSIYDASGKLYTTKTLKTGSDNIKLSIKSGKYTICVKYNGNTIYNTSSKKTTFTVSKINTIINANIIKQTQNDTQVKVSIIDVYGKVVSSGKISVLNNGEIITTKTITGSLTLLTFKLPEKIEDIVILYSGTDDYYNANSINQKITLTNY